MAGVVPLALLRTPQTRGLTRARKAQMSRRTRVGTTTDTCCDFDGTGVDDVAYLLGLLDEVAKKVRVRANRVVLIGHSAGGFMAYRLACEATKRVAAVVSIAGSGWKDGSKCKAEGGVSVLQVHGAQDDVMPFAGDSGAPGALEMLQRWAVRGSCSWASWAQAKSKLELAADTLDHETTVWQLGQPCKQAVDVRLWKMAGTDHYPEFRPQFTEKALSWALGQ